MTTTERAALTDVETPSVKAYPGTRLAGWLTTTDHKRIGALYLITSFSFFLLAGVLALLIRAELARPGLQIVNEEVYNQLFTPCMARSCCCCSRRRCSSASRT